MYFRSAWHMSEISVLYRVGNDDDDDDDHNPCRRALAAVAFPRVANEHRVGEPIKVWFTCNVRERDFGIA